MKFAALVICAAWLGVGLSRASDIPLPDNAQLRWQQHERIMFVCLDPCTWEGREYDDHSVPLSRIAPWKLDTDQWCRVASLWGAKQILFVAKHTGGFCWWQTTTTDYGIKNTPWRNGKGDVLADLSISCRKFGLDLGVYVYPGDETWGAGIGSGGRTSDPSNQEAYNKVFRQQLTEVLSNYGTIREVWFDGSCVIDVRDILKKYASKAVILQGPVASLRWVGTEDGYAPFSNWYTLSSKDLQTGVATAVQSDPFGDAYAPVEVDVPLLKNEGHKWFWAPNTDQMILSTDQLMDRYYKSVGRGSVLLLNSTPDTTGLIPESHAAAYKAFGDEIRRRFDTPLGRTKGEGKMLEIVLPKVTEVNHAILQEDLSKGQRVLAFTIQAQDERGAWTELYDATSVGFKRICSFDPVKTRKVRVVFTNAKAEPSIANFALYSITGAMPAPEQRDDRDRFYDGVRAKQGEVVSQEPAVRIATWATGAESDGWREISIDLTEHVTRIGQYEITFVPAGGGNADLEFRDWRLEMYGGTINDAIEQLKGRPVFRLTRSQQTLNDFPARFRVKVKTPDGAQSGSITIRRITY